MCALRQIKIEHDNCTFDNQYSIEECGDSKIFITASFDKIVSLQSKNALKRELVASIQSSLQQFKWIAIGAVNLELLWFLHGTNRQETDSTGDLDNITKPVVDSLAGPNGIIVDDSQVKSLYTYWRLRNEETDFDSVRIEISFSNDYYLPKQDLVFIQYNGPMCVALSVPAQAGDYSGCCPLRQANLNSNHGVEHSCRIAIGRRWGAAAAVCSG